MRKILVSGFVAVDAQKQISKQNTEYVSFSLANREFNDKRDADGNIQTTWYRITCFNPRLNAFAAKLKKGANVMVIGDVNDSIYQNKNGGVSIDHDVIADSISYYGFDNSNNKDTQNSQSSNRIIDSVSRLTSGDDGMPTIDIPRQKKGKPVNEPAQEVDSVVDDGLPF